MKDEVKKEKKASEAILDLFKEFVEGASKKTVMFDVDYQSVALFIVWLIGDRGEVGERELSILNKKREKRGKKNDNNRNNPAPQRN